MSRKVTLSTYEQMILAIGGMTAPELESILKCAKVRLAQMKPKATRAKKKKESQSGDIGRTA